MHQRMNGITEWPGIVSGFFCPCGKGGLLMTALRQQIQRLLFNACKSSGDLRGIGQQRKDVLADEICLGFLECWHRYFPAPCASTLVASATIFCRALSARCAAVSSVVASTCPA